MIAPAMVIACVAMAGRAMAQMSPLEEYSVSIRVDSGKVMNRNAERSVVWSQTLYVENASSLRLYFDKAVLGVAPEDGRETILRITSLFDHGVQELTNEHLKQWRNSTAYFNGNVVLLEIEADAGAGPSRVIARTAKAAPVRPLLDEEPERTICGSTDDRTLSSDVRVGRTVPVGCTAWLIDDLNHCMLSAGHCSHSFGGDLVEFNVPLSNGSGTWIHSHPDDQYIVDQSSIQLRNNDIGDDWQYFGCFPNPNTGLTAAQAQGDWFILDFTPPAPSGQQIRVTGYGTTTAPVLQTWNRAQKTHTGQYVSYSGASAVLKYKTDTTGGNSGSPVIDESTGLAIGIHTHGGCTAVNGENNGTAVNKPSLLNALANPLGVCAPQPPANDQCSSAILLTGSPASMDTTNATDAGMVESCGSIYNDVWYRVIVGEPSELSLVVCDAGFAPRVAVYGASCPSGNLKALACADVSCGDALTLEVPAGAYRIRVGSNSDDGGTAMLHYVVEALPDPCAADIAPPGGDGAVTIADVLAVVTAFGATGEGLAGDIAPTGGDGQVTIADVVEAVSAFGTACP